MSEPTPPSQMSPWKRADKAFGFGFFVGVASFYQGNKNNTDFSSSGQMLFAGCCGLFVGLIAYLAAVAYYAAQRKPESAIQPNTTKPYNRSGLVWFGGIIGFLVILSLIVNNQETKTAQEKPDSRAVSQVEKPSNAVDAETQAAAKFRKDFFDKYPDLIPYESVVDAVALKLKASGYKGESREAVMAEFAKEARNEILTENSGNVARFSGNEQRTAPFVRASPVTARAGDIDFYNSGGKAVS